MGKGRDFIGTHTTHPLDLCDMKPAICITEGNIREGSGCALLAVICSELTPNYLWLATGGKSQFNERPKVLYGHDVVAFPDVDGYST